MRLVEMIFGKKRRNEAALAPVRTFRKLENEVRPSEVIMTTNAGNQYYYRNYSSNGPNVVLLSDVDLFAIALRAYFAGDNVYLSKNGKKQDMKLLANEFFTQYPEKKLEVCCGVVLQ